MGMRGRLRGVRDANGQPIFQRVMQERGRYELDGEPIEFPRNGAVDAARSLLVSGDYQQLLFCMRQDVTFRIFTEE
jgi:HK97 family phage major capsid protein